MTQIETLDYLKSDGFFGARLKGTNEVFCMNGGFISLWIGNHDEPERVLTEADFELQYSGCEFVKLNPEEAIRCA